MKRIIVTVIALMFSVLLNAQDPHLKFKGIPINGEYKSFSQKLVQKGFKQVNVSADGIVLVGNFMATPEVMVVVYPDPTSKAVSMVSAMIETGDNWVQIESKYYDVINTYKEKYGEPKNHVEEFTSDAYDSEFRRMTSLQNGQCNYKTLWETEGGRIVIAPAYYNLNYYIVCTYIDEQNYKALRQTIIDDI